MRVGPGFAQGHRECGEDEGGGGGVFWGVFRRRLQLVLGWFKEPRLKNHPSDIVIVNRSVMKEEDHVFLKETRPDPI